MTEHPGKAALAVIMKNLDGVTPGDWESHGDVVDPSSDQMNAGYSICETVGPHAHRNAAHVALCGPNPMRSIAAYVAELEALRDKATHLVGEAARKQGEAEGRLHALQSALDFAQTQRLENYYRAVDAETREVTLAEALELPEIKAVVDAVSAEIVARQKYENTPTDRGGAKGPKGQAQVNWDRAAYCMGAALAALKGGDA